MDGYVTIGTELDTKGFDKEIAVLEDKLNDIQATLQLADKDKKLFSTRQIKEMEAEAEKLNNRLITLRQKQKEIDNAGFMKMKDSMKNIGKSIGDIIKKVSKWALAVFGLRSAYMAVRNAINIISQDDEQLRADIDYMKAAMAYTLEPVVRKIVDLARQLLVYFGYVIKMLTGKNIFENANKSLKGAVGSAKELKKQLAGFDEMNILSDSSSSGGGGGGSSATPSFNLAEEVNNLKEPKWLKVVKDIGQWILDNWDDVVFTIVSAFSPVFNLFGLVVANIITTYTQIKTILTTLIPIIKDKVITPIKDLFSVLWNNLKEGFSLTINGIKDKFVSLKTSIKNIISGIVDLFKNIGTKVGDAIGGAFKAVINGVLKAIENILNFPIKQINKLLDVINKVPGINISKLSTFSLPRLAKGGIVNMPGRGVPIGGAIGGEQRPEGVIPLTDSQQMALLGEAIGKYITVNANIVNTMNGRVISRELQKVQNETNFAMNR